MDRQFLYKSIWEEHLTDINHSIKNGGGTITLNQMDFSSAGNRKSYRFNLKIPKGDIPRISSTAVARDLKYVLDNSSEFRELAQNRDLIIKMGKDFKLEIQVQQVYDDLSDDNKSQKNTPKIIISCAIVLFIIIVPS